MFVIPSDESKVSEKEMESKLISVRKHKVGDQGSTKLEVFLNKINKEILDKTLPPLEDFSFQKRSAASRAAAARDY